MSLITKAGEATLLLSNVGRENATGPVFFPSFDPAVNFSFSIWTYPLGGPGIAGIAMVDYAGVDGSQIILGHNGFNWAYITRNASVAQETLYFDDVVWNRWACFCYVKHGANITIYYGLQDADDQNPAAHPVVLKQVISTVSNDSFDLFNFSIRLGNSYYLSNFKFWNETLTMSDIQAQSNRFDVNPLGGIAPFWSSTLRTPGDISSIAFPSTGPNDAWAATHGYTDSPDWKDLKIGGDPAYMETTPCPTWIYPIQPPQDISFNPGNTPLVPTTYDCPGFQEFEDRGSLDDVDSALVSIEYLAQPSSAFIGVQPTDHWPLYTDENGTKVVSAHGAADRFEQDTGVTVPKSPTVPGVKISTMYAWRYGAQITWQPHFPAPIPAAGSSIGALYLYVVYIGIPTGIPRLPVGDMTGLFAIIRPQDPNPPIPGTDTYNRGRKLAIPAPTIRTAYLGE